MKNLKIKSLAAALIASTIMTTALPVCAAENNLSDQTAVSAEAAAQNDNPSDYTMENGTRVIKDASASAYVYEGGKSGVIIIENPSTFWSDNRCHFSYIGGVALSDIINYDNTSVSMIFNYKDDIPGIYDYRVKVYGKSKSNWGPGVSFKFMDEEYDIYSLHYNDYLSLSAGYETHHFVDYNSKKPNIVRIDWEFTDL